jgi:polyketide synthase PksN
MLCQFESNQRKCIEERDHMGNNDKFSCYIIGDGALLIACGELIIDSGHDIYGVISSNPLIREWAEDKGIKCVDHGSDYSEFLRQKPFDYLFSIVYLNLIPKELLALPKKMAINFHDALLPEYAGIHATSWAIMNKETRHGITWHEMVSEVDKGNILKQKTIKIEDNETAFSLNVKCYEVGLESFTELLDELAADSYALTFQDLNRRTYYGKYKRPPVGCVLSWKSSAEEMDAIVRALQFGKYQNKLGIAKLAVADEYIIVDHIRVTRNKSDLKPGTIVDITELNFKVATVSNDIEISSVMLINGAPLPVADCIKKYNLKLGDSLVEMDSEIGTRITLLHDEISKYEDYWINKLLHIDPTIFPGLVQVLEDKYSTNYSVVDFAISDEFINYTKKDYSNMLAGYLAAISSFLFKECKKDSIQVSIGYKELSEDLKRVNNLFAAHVPVKLELNDTLAFRDVCDIAREEIESVKKHKTFLHDLIVRSPQLNDNSILLGRTVLPIIIEYVKDFENYSQATLNRQGISFVIPEKGNTCRIVFSEEVLAKEKAAIYSNRLTTFIARVAAMPETTLSKLTTLADDELHRVIYERNNTAVDYPRDKCMHELFKERVKQYPEKIAVLYKDESLTYMELEERSSRLASFLNRNGVVRGSLIGIFVERSLDMLVGLLGVLKSGGTYVPIDPIYPSERILHMIEDADIEMIITQEKIEHKLPQSEARTVCLDKDWEEICKDSGKSSSRKYYSYSNKNTSPEDSAYVIFTSGSTGKPKGVEVTHRGLTNFLCSMERCPGFTNEDRILALTTICFDIAGLELYLPLITGGQVEILPTEIARDGFELKEKIENGITTIVQATPATWEMLLEAGWNRKVPIKILCGGEALSAELAQKLLDRSSEVWNVYGPTETTIWSSVSRVNSGEEITVGQPIANTQFYIVDEYLKPVPDGIEGELCIGGDGLAKGYLNRPDLTKEKFILNPFDTEKKCKIYKTGDSAKYLPDGRVICLGRIDNQVKLRGFRIELGEIESVLEKQPQIKKAVVVVKEDNTGYKGLSAFIVPEKSTIPVPVKKLSEAVKEFLPEYMVPVSYIYMDILPLTLNLKVDRKILESMPTAQIIEKYGYKEIDNDIGTHKQGDRIKTKIIDCKDEYEDLTEYFEKDLVEIVAEVVKTTKEGIDLGVPMGEYGYDSIRFTVLSKRIKDKYDIVITPAQFYTYTTINKLKEYILNSFKEQIEEYYGKNVNSEHKEQPCEDTPLNLETCEIPLENEGFGGHFEKDLVEIVAGVVKISKEEIHLGVPMGEYGYDSIRFTVLSKKIKDKYDIVITPAQFYTYTTIHKLTDFVVSKYREQLQRYYVDITADIKIVSTYSATDELKGQKNSFPPELNQSRVDRDSSQDQREPVAIIGISGIFPQSPDLETFWDNIVNKRDLITEISDDRWNASNYYIKMAEKNNIAYSKWGGFIEDVDKFDAAFFNISPREAERMDPQQRIFLEMAWKAIENAGYKPSDLSGTKTGVYVGAVSSDYWDMMLCNGLEADPYTISGNVNCVIANRVSYLLNLQGASASIDTACSSSLVAIHRAVAAIQNGYCDMAIAGGVNVILNPFMHIALSTNGMLSADGHCKTFDSRANGYVRGEGAGALILKPLSKAIADGDCIHAVIRGSSENHGGRTNSLTAPNPNAQTDLLISAYTEARIDPSTVTYIEAHGTGTSLGDPIEINGLKMAFEELRKEWGMQSAEKYCGLGSVKTNIGHLEAGAGVAGLLKIVLAMQKGILPGMIHFKEQNPYIDLEGSPFYIVSETQEWGRLTDEAGKIVPRRAGVSSFGFGGSNSHIVLEEYCSSRSSSTVNYHSPNIFVLSAKNEDRLKAYAMDMLKYLEKFPICKEKGEGVENAFSDITYTLQMGREVMNKRLAIVASDMEELIEKLKQYCAGKKEITQVYTGSIGSETKNILNLLEGNCGKEFLAAIVREKEYKNLANLWVAGVLVDWKLLYDNPKPRRISLPTYPFAKERYWIPKSEIKSVNNCTANMTASFIHPLLHKNTSNFSEQRFSSTFTGQEFFLADHIVKRQRVLPGVAYLEMARAAVEVAAGDWDGGQRGIQLKNVVWARPIAVGEHPVQVNIRLFPEDNGEISYEIYRQSEEADAELIVHSQGSAILSLATEAPMLDIEALQVQCNQGTLSSRQCYEAFSKMGIDYGLGHQGIEKMYMGKGQVLAKLSLPSSVFDTQAQFMLHPSLIDSALQAFIGLMMDFDNTVLSSNIEPLKPVLPFALQEIEIFRKCTTTMWSFVRYSDGSKAGDIIQRLDIDLCDDKGTICAQVKGFTTRVLEGEVGLLGSPVTSETLMFEPIWKEQIVNQKVLPPDYAQHLIIFCEPNKVFNEKIKNYMNNVSCITLQSNQKDIEERFQTYAIQAFEKIQGILKDKPKSKVLIQIVVSMREEQQLFSGLSGLLKTAQLENPQIIGQLIEMESWDDTVGIAEKLKENSQSPMDSQIRYKNGKRWVVGWNEIEKSQGAVVVPWKDNGIYLITGGAGGLGLIFAEEIARKVRGATLILVGRSSLNEGKQGKLKELEVMGVNIEYKQVDVTNKKAVTTLVESIQKHYSRLDGIIHGAGMIRDNFIIKKNKEEFHEVIAAKVSGLVNLDQASKDLSLDFVILFSSITGSLGNLGQIDYAAANAFMNAYAGYRNALVALKQRQGQTLSINWPLWKDGGMHVNKETEKMMTESMGMIAMQTTSGIQLLYQGLVSGKDQIMVMEGNGVALRSFMGLGSTLQGIKKAEDKISVSHDILREQTVKIVKEIMANAIKIAPENIQLNTPFENYGIDSIMQINIIRELEKVTGELSKTLLFEYSTTQELVDYFEKNHSDKILEVRTLEKPTKPINITNSQPDSPKLLSHRNNRIRFRQVEEEQLVNRQASEDIAIIGISGRYPLSNNLEELWEHLKAGHNCIMEAPNRRWENSLSKVFSKKKMNQIGKKYYGGFLNQIDQFDYRLFGISREQVLEIPPEVRMFLETVWETFEDGGYNKFAWQEVQDRYQEGIGVFVGTMYSQYSWSIPLLEQAVLNSNITDWQIANRTSHFFNLTGPSIAINSACSSSLTAIHLACESLKQKSCSMAIAGGVNLTLDPSKYDALQRIKFLGSGNKSKSFGTGDGYIPGEGVGAVLLKPLSMAIRDNDRIHGVIKSSFVNHSGGRQMYTAPDSKHQAQLITKSIHRSGIDATTIGYVESAANGSAFGDPIEVIALNNAFMNYTDKKQYCALGSVKSNLGHLEAASGISQLSKVLLQMKHKTLVPTINANPMNPNIKLERTAFYLQEETAFWSQLKDQKTGKSLPRRSMINSFGAGGAYANLIVEEYIEEVSQEQSSISLAQESLVVFSAKTKWSLVKYLQKMYDFLQNNPNITIKQIARSLQKINHNLEYRAAIIASSIHDLLEKLDIVLREMEIVTDFNIYISLDPKSNGTILDESIIQQALEKENLRELAQYWIDGVRIDFKQQNEDIKTSWLSLPKYAFEHTNEFNFDKNDSLTNKEAAQFNKFYLNLVESIASGEVSEDEVEKIIFQRGY